MFKIAMITFAGLLLMPTLAAADPANDANYLRYSYRDHYRAYGASSRFSNSLPQDEYYYDPCYRLVSSRRGLIKKFVCRI